MEVYDLPDTHFPDAAYHLWIHSYLGDRGFYDRVISLPCLLANRARLRNQIQHY